MVFSRVTQMSKMHDTIKKKLQKVRKCGMHVQGRPSPSHVFCGSKETNDIRMVYDGLGAG
jgi:hypothetical protein